MNDKKHERAGDSPKHTTDSKITILKRKLCESSQKKSIFVIQQIWIDVL